MNASNHMEPRSALDGNAAGGLLRQLFTFEPSSAEITCAGCGAVAPVGAVALHGGVMGAVLRCAGCDAVLIRLTHTPHGYWLDMRGARLLFVRSWSE